MLRKSFGKQKTNEQNSIVPASDDKKSKITGNLTVSTGNDDKRVKSLEPLTVTNKEINRHTSETKSV